MKELSLRPYNGRLFLASSRKDYEKGHKGGEPFCYMLSQLMLDAK